jgi:hypothetical protein
MLLQWYVAARELRVQDADEIVDIPVSSPLPSLVQGIHPKRELLLL